jgi:predicted Zn-dependent protease with MMP-like domain
MAEPDEVVTDEERELFDGVVDEVVASLPADLRAKLEQIPLIVEDYPSDDVLDELGIADEDIGTLCGLHTGIPLTQRSVEHSGTLPDMIHVYRDGVLNLSLDRRCYIDERKLRKQVRITILHEIGHHFGLDEDDLRELGYA